MKQLSVVLFSGILSVWAFSATAQEDVKAKEKKKTEEIVIRKTGEKDISITVEIKGDNITVNGKPLSEFKNDDVTVNNRKVIIRDGSGLAALDRLGKMDIPNITWSRENSSKVVLGVVTAKTDKGVEIEEVTESSAAAKAGLEKGDIITKLDGEKIEEPQDLFDAVNKKKANDEVSISYKRGGKDKSAKARLQERKDISFSLTAPDGSYKAYSFPAKPGMPATPRPQPFDMSEHLDFAYSFSGKPKLGLKIQDLEEGDGVKVLDVEENSNSAKAGLKKDDIITEIGGAKVKNTDEAREALMESDDKSTYQIKAKRNGKEMSFDIKIPKKIRTTNL